MRKCFGVLALFLCVLSGVFAQNTSAEDGGSEIPNTVAAVKAANPGDYILLKSGKKYVLTAEEIDIVNGRFNYGDLSGVKTETRNDGTKIKTISEAHTVYAYPDGQSQHIIKTGVSFSAYMEFVEEKYHVARYVDILDEYHDLRIINSPRFDVFRASVQFRTLSNGTEEVEDVTVIAYNYRGRSFMVRYSSAPDMVWGNISSEGSYKPTGETHEIEFDIE